MAKVSVLVWFQVYLPSMLVVMFSWITFWVEMDAGNQVCVFVQMCSSFQNDK